MRNLERIHVECGASTLNGESLHWGIFLFGRLNEKFVPGVELPPVVEQHAVEPSTKLPAGDELKCISFHFVVCPYIVTDKLLKWKQANIEHHSVGFPFKPQVNSL